MNKDIFGHSWGDLPMIFTVSLIKIIGKWPHFLHKKSCGQEAIYHSVLMLHAHYVDLIMSAMASPITSLTIVYSIVYSGADQRKHQSSASLAFVRGIHRWPVNSLHKRPVTRKMFPFDDVIMCILQILAPAQKHLAPAQKHLQLILFKEILRFFFTTSDLDSLCFNWWKMCISFNNDTVAPKQVALS